MTISIHIDKRADIHVTTPAGAGRLAVVGPDGVLLDTSSLAAALKDALLDAILDELTPALRQASRRLEPPPSHATPPVPLRRSRPRRAMRPSAD